MGFITSFAKDGGSTSFQGEDEAKKREKKRKKAKKKKKDRDKKKSSSSSSSASRTMALAGIGVKPGEDIEADPVADEVAARESEREAERRAEEKAREEAEAKARREANIAAQAAYYDSGQQRASEQGAELQKQIEQDTEAEKRADAAAFNRQVERADRENRGLAAQIAGFLGDVSGYNEYVDSVEYQENLLEVEDSARAVLDDPSLGNVADAADDSFKLSYGLLADSGLGAANPFAVGTNRKATRDRNAAIFGSEEQAAGVTQDLYGGAAQFIDEQVDKTPVGDKWYTDLVSEALIQDPIASFSKVTTGVDPFAVDGSARADVGLLDAFDIVTVGAGTKAKSGTGILSRFGSKADEADDLLPVVARGSDEAADLADDVAKGGPSILKLAGGATVAGAGGFALNEYLNSTDQIELADGTKLVKEDDLPRTDDHADGGALWRVERNGATAGYTIVLGAVGRNIRILGKNGQPKNSRVTKDVWEEAIKAGRGGA